MYKAAFSNKEFCTIFLGWNSEMNAVYAPWACIAMQWQKDAKRSHDTN